MKAAVLGGSAFFSTSACGSEKTLLKQAGLDVRRISAQSRFALAGVLPWLDMPLPPDTAVFLGTDFGSPQLFVAMQENVRQGFAKPLDFLAHLHNAPLFHVCAALGLNGVALVEAADGRAANILKPLWQAQLHLHAAGGQALVGWCREYCTADGGAAGGSVWLHLSAEAAGAACLEGVLQTASTASVAARRSEQVFAQTENADFVRQVFQLFAGLQSGSEVLLDAPLPGIKWKLTAESALPMKTAGAK